jgi:hypothetical protein
MEYTCYRCFYKTNKKSSFKDHINRKSLCKKIDKSYNYTDHEIKDLIDRQLNSKTYNEKSKFICNICNKNFTESYNLNKHMKNHDINTQDIKINLINNNNVINSNNVINNTINNITIINNIKNINMDIKPVPFDEDWDLSKIDSSTIQSILLSNVMYTKLLEEILKTDLNLNVIVENQTNSGLVYKNDIEKYVNMKIQDITKNSMNKLNKHLMDLHSNLDNIILDDYLKKIKSLIDLKYENYIKNKNNIQENVDNCIINIYNDVKDDAINLCKINNCENDGY